jgi:hypothetical protein
MWSAKWSCEKRELVPAFKGQLGMEGTGIRRKIHELVRIEIVVSRIERKRAIDLTKACAF